MEVPNLLTDLYYVYKPAATPIQRQRSEESKLYQAAVFFTKIGLNVKCCARSVQAEKDGLFVEFHYEENEARVQKRLDVFKHGAKSNVKGIVNYMAKNKLI